MYGKMNFYGEYNYEDFTLLQRSEFHNPRKIVISFIKFYKKYYKHKIDLFGTCGVAGLKIISEYCSNLEDKELAKEYYTKLTVEFQKSFNSEDIFKKATANCTNNLRKISLIEKFEKIFSFIGFLLALFFEYLIRDTVLKEIPFAYYNPLIGAGVIWYLGRVFLEDYPEIVHNYIWWKLFDSISLKIKSTITSLDIMYREETYKLKLVAESLIKNTV